MNVGITIARNVIKADYPIKEAIFSVLPLVDDFVVAVGNSDDDTRNYIAQLNEIKDPNWPEIRIIDTVWDDTLREGGRVLAVETNKAFAAVPAEATWVIYIQADECLHQEDYPAIQAAMKTYAKDDQVQGLLFKYKHFYGSYDYVGDSRRWYRNEIRIIKNRKDITSWKDAQGFRFLNEQKLHVKPIDAYVYHYGWVKHPKAQQQKQEQFHRLWHDDNFMQKNVLGKDSFDYGVVDSLQHYHGSHPSIMAERINRINWKFEVDPTKKNFGLKAAFLYWFEKTFGIRLGEYKNYKIV